MESLLGVLQAIVGIGALIVIHELGHFLVGRACGVMAEAFSVGFGPVLLRWKPGETEYRLSAVPLGGYVKFLGAEPDERGSVSPRSFHAASYPRKVAIMLAGVAMNVVAAFLLFVFTFTRGIEVVEPVVGQVAPDSPAAEHGLLEGDRILSIDGGPVYDFGDVIQDVATAEVVEIVVERDGRVLPPLRIPTRPSPDGIRQLGIAPAERTDGAFGVVPGSPAEEAGLRTGDRLVAVGERPVGGIDEAFRLHALDGGPASWRVLRDGEELEVAVPRVEAFQIGVGLGAESSEGGLPIAAVPEGSPAAAAGLAAGSVILSADGVPVDGLPALRAAVDAAGRESRPVKLTWRDPDGTVHADTAVVTEPSRDRFGTVPVARTYVLERDDLVGAAALGFDRTHRWMMRILGTLKALVTRQVSPRQLAGPVAIAKMSYEHARTGLAEFALFLGMISMNLAVLNLLPIPMLDGGQLTLLTVERVRGSPLPERVLVGVQWAGLLLLLALMLFVVTNDILRL